jgi:hypothetical protein
MRTDSNHFKVVNDSLNGRHPVDERTYSSLAVLAERLERLKKSNELFHFVRFSDDVEELKKNSVPAAVG